MRSSVRQGVRLLGAIVLVATMIPVTGLLGQTSGRDYSRCIQACNETRRSCDDRCAGDCAIAFGKDVAARNACKSACHAVCVSESQDCKLVCRAQKNGESNEEP